MQKGSSALYAAGTSGDGETVRGDGSRLLATTEGLPQIIAELTHGGADVRSIVPVMPQVAYWRCNPLLLGTGGLHRGNRKSGIRGQRRLMHHQRRIIGSWVTSLFHMENAPTI